MADTEERFRIVQQSLEMTGRSFQSLGRFEKIAFAQAAGFRSVDEAARAFGNTQEDIATKIGDTTITQAEMNELAIEATDTITKLKFAFFSFAKAVKPLADSFAQMVETFIEFGEGFPGGFAGMISTIALVGGAIVGILAAIPIIAALAPAAGVGTMLAGTAALPVAGAALLAMLGGMGGMGIAASVDDAIVRGDTIIPINTSDDILAAKPDGPIDRALGAQTAGLSPTGGGMMDAFRSGGLPVYVVGSRGTGTRATAPPPTSRGDTTLVVKVMIDDRELGEAMVPHIDKRVLGTV